MSEPHVHFWLMHGVAGIDGWDPDRDPDRFEDGLSHAILELYIRLRNRGDRVTIGPRTPRSADLVVVFSKQVAPRTLSRLLVQRAPIVVVMSDHPVDRPLAIRPEARIQPYEGACSRPTDSHLPLLPQRGLIPRNGNRGSEIRVLGYFGSQANAPDWLSSDRFRSDLERRGLSLRLAFGPTATGSNPWNDFSEVDVALCVRSSQSDLTSAAKPPTKVINAWTAGAIPVAQADPAVTEIAHHRSDSLIVPSPASVDDVIAAADLLLRNPTLAVSIYEKIDSWRTVNTTTRIVDEWSTRLAQLSGLSPDHRRRVTGGAVLGSLTRAVHDRLHS